MTLQIVAEDKLKLVCILVFVASRGWGIIAGFLSWVTYSGLLRLKHDDTSLVYATHLRFRLSDLAQGD